MAGDATDGAQTAAAGVRKPGRMAGPVLGRPQGLPLGWEGATQGAEGSAGRYSWLHYACASGEGNWSIAYLV